jgi:hypothetical protein
MVWKWNEEWLNVEEQEMGVGNNNNHHRADRKARMCLMTDTNDDEVSDNDGDSDERGCDKRARRQILGERDGELWTGRGRSRG